MHTSTLFSHRWSRILTSMWIFMWERRRSGRNALVLSGQPILYSSRIARYTFNFINICILTCIEDGDWVTLSETMLCKAHGFIPCVCIFICQYIVGYVYWIMLLDGVYVGSWDDNCNRNILWKLSAWSAWWLWSLVNSGFLVVKLFQVKSICWQIVWLCTTVCSSKTTEDGELGISISCFK